MDMQRSLIQKFMLFMFEISENAAVATKNICCELVKAELITEQ